MAIGGARIRWSWDGNLHRFTPVTRTGIRTPPSMWVNDMNKKPSPVELTGMARNVENGRWFTGQLTQIGDGHQDMGLQRFFDRMNWHTSLAALSRMNWPGRDQSSSMAYCLESMSQVSLFKRAGWGDGILDPPADVLRRVWGWGGHFATRDWDAMMYRVLVLTNELGTALKSGDCSAQTVYFPLSNVQPFSTSADSFAYGMEGFEVADFRPLASWLPQPGRSSGGLTPSGETATHGAPRDGLSGEGIPDCSKSSDGMGSRTTTVPTASSLERTVTNVVPAAGHGTSATSGMISTTRTSRVVSSEAQDASPSLSDQAMPCNQRTKSKLGTDGRTADVHPDHRAPQQAT